MAHAIASYDSRDTGSQPDPEARLAELGRAAGPLRRAAAAIARRMCDDSGWERLGFATAGDYARERLGLSVSSLQEWARVDRSLDDLPALEAALLSGALPWSKVRMLARFVTAESEVGWIEHARLTGVRRLEREVRAVDRGALETGGLLLDEDGRACEPTETVRIPGSLAMSFGFQRLKRCAARVAGEALAAAAVLEMVTAETLSALPLDERGVEEWGGAESDAEGTLEPHAAEACEQEIQRPDIQRPDIRPPDARPSVSAADRELPPFLRSLVVGLDDASPFELDARLRRVVNLEQRLDAAIGPLLRQVTSKSHEWRAEFQTLAAFAREQLGMSPRKARALLCLERAADGCAELKIAYRDGALSWLRAQILVPLLLDDEGPEGPWREAWVAAAGRITVRRLEDIVGHAVALRRADPDCWLRLCGDPAQLMQIVGPDGAPDGAEGDQRQVCADPIHPEEGPGLTIRAPAPVARLFRATLCSVRRAAERASGSLPSEGRAFEAMMAHALGTWGVDEPWLARRMRRLSPVFERDGWRCTVPGCSSRRNLHAHHIVFRSAGGSDGADNLTTLCAVHHQRGVHAGRISVRGKAPDALRFELGLRPGLPPLERYRSGDFVV